MYPKCIQNVYYPNKLSNTIIFVYIFLVSDLISYILIGLSFYQVLRYKKIGNANVIWHMIHILFVACASIFYFNEDYTLK